MRVLVTGSLGYIGSVLTPLLKASNFEVVGLDAGWFRDCTFEDPSDDDVSKVPVDIRDVTVDDLRGFDVVMYLAALSNDPLGNLDSGLTFEINHRGTMRFAELAKQAGVSRFIFSSSCSLYGAAGSDSVTETAEMNPVTPYGETKALVDRELAAMASEDFSPVLLRNATAYGASPRLRLDLVLNDLVGSAMTTGRILMKSDGTPWRPIVHVEDICRAFIAAAEAPRDAIHGQAFNVGATAENYRIAELAEIVKQTVPGSTIEFAEGAGPDARSYRVDFGKIEDQLPGFKPLWNATRGAQELYDAYQEQNFTENEHCGPRFRRLPRIQQLVGTDAVDAHLRWKREINEVSLTG